MFKIALCIRKFHQVLLEQFAIFIKLVGNLTIEITIFLNQYLKNSMILVDIRLYDKL